MTQKDASYHEAAIRYNESLAEHADQLATELQHEEVARWSRSVAKQHRFHAGRHRKALEKLRAAVTRSAKKASESQQSTETETVPTGAAGVEEVRPKPTPPAFTPTTIPNSN